MCNGRMQDCAWKNASCYPSVFFHISIHFRRVFEFDDLPIQIRRGFDDLPIQVRWVFDDLNSNPLSFRGVFDAYPSLFRRIFDSFPTGLWTISTYYPISSLLELHFDELQGMTTLGPIFLSKCFKRGLWDAIPLLRTTPDNHVELSSVCVTVCFSDT